MPRKGAGGKRLGPQETLLGGDWTTKGNLVEGFKTLGYVSKKDHENPVLVLSFLSILYSTCAHSAG